ncbi:SgrR family transcriptional regulator [Rouxiella sp. S1S-2]|uniref:SgrR family transcriptional regulator n=1 Tax=Rouxiella sp. S1S-2 TaxID=2653856 RepID=UPI00126552A4|nr:SgrR family transcriptional regulator [Rouxiella sp. S1S-2]KAB7898093.1 SgrR family transcriptional regulator [Rouxiella sp. S1S-2]
MRLQNRLNQYQRLYDKTGLETQAVTVASLAVIFFCSERHTRTLLTQFQEAGWISWSSQAGRGKRAQISCLKTPESLRESYLLKLLNEGEHSAALQLTQLDPQHLNSLLAPHLGGQWQEDAPTLRIPYYRPMQVLDPQTLSGRAEQHIAHTLHAGLTRFITGQPTPQPDLAHHWQIREEGKVWQFFLRSQLYWHNGEPLLTRQLCQLFEKLRHSAHSRHSLENVDLISQPHALCLQFSLKKPDYWLAHRLADLSCLLFHPAEPTVGAGPFKLAHFAAERVRLEQHPYYHLQRPYLSAIEYWISPQLYEQKGNDNVSCQHPVRIILGEKSEMDLVRPVRRSTSLGFCYLAVNQQRQHLTPLQAQKIIALIQNSGLLDNLPIDHSLVKRSREMLPGWPLPDVNQNNTWLADVPLPPRLTLMFHPPIELKLLADELKIILAAHGCELHTSYHSGRLWDNAEQLAEVDIILGDRLIGEAPVATLENWLRQDLLWPTILDAKGIEQQNSRLLEIQQLPSESLREERLREHFSQLMQQGSITPLFNYQYQVSAPPGVNGVQLTAWGWFDFCQAWLPPPLDERD